jgi:cytoskeleton protein RodZ
MTKLTQMTLDNGGDDDGPGRRRIHLREISGDHDSEVETVGQELRAARLRRGDEIAQVSRALKIRKDHLEALEEDRLEDLPGKTYAIGFVRSYARHLGLDANAYVERFKREISGRAEDKMHEPAPIHQDDGRRLPQGWRIITGGVLILLGWGAWHLLSSGMSSNQPVPPAPVLNPPKPVTPPKPAPLPAQSAVPSPSTSVAPPAGNNTTDQEAATPPPAAGAKTPATSLPPAHMASSVPPTNGLPPTSLPTTSLPTTGLPPANAASSASPAAVPDTQVTMPAEPGAIGAGRVFGAGNENPRVILRVHGNVRISIKSPEGEMILNRDLRAGDVYQVPNTPGITLATSNAGVVEIDLDGIALGRVGEPEQVLGRVSLDPQSLNDRFNNH